MERQVLGYLYERMFCQHMRLNSTAFKCLCQVLLPTISTIDTNMKACILMETKVQLHFQNWEVKIPC
jgi:hypothetical protein